MTIAVTPHINFRAQARAALEFYAAAFGGELTLVTYADMGAVQDPAEADQIMWGQVAAPNGFRLMAFDMPAARPWSPGESPFYVAARGTDVDELTATWQGLLDGATVLQPIGPAPWGSPLYGMLTDRFGITWVLDIVA